MTTRLDQFAALEAAATAAPWTANEAGYLANYERDAYIAHGQDGAGAIARSEDGFFIAAARNLAPQFIRLARAAQRAVKAREAIQGFGDTREWVEPLLALSKEHDEAMDEMRAALDELLAEATDA